jgi:uncharacterized protein (TIGR03000 family)
VLGVAALLASTQLALAGGPPYGIPSGVMPWEYYKYQGYKEPPHGYKPRPPQPPTVSQSPTRYTVRVTRLPYKHTADDPNVVVMVAHVPDDASIWFDDAPTRQTGTVRWFESPPLKPGHDYSYTVRVVWHEDGRWVSQVHKYPVKPGDIQCIDIIPSTSEAVEQEVAASLAKLGADDRKAAHEQRFCAVQDGIRLGAMGVPVKVTLKGQPVFLCCEACLKKAQGNPEKTLEKLQGIKAKNTSQSSP